MRHVFLISAATASFQIHSNARNAHRDVLFACWMARATSARQGIRLILVLVCASLAAAPRLGNISQMGLPAPLAPQTALLASMLAITAQLAPSIKRIRHSYSTTIVFQFVLMVSSPIVRAEIAGSATHGVLVALTFGIVPAADMTSTFYLFTIQLTLLA